MSTYSERGEKLKKENKTAVDEQTAVKKEELDLQIDHQLQKAEQTVSAGVDTADANYRSVVDAAAVQRELDRRQIQETMANMGLSRSGLNATQQTAVQLSAGNKMASAAVQRQAAVDALKKSLADYRIEFETERRVGKQSLDEAAAKSVAEYNAEVDKSVNEAESAEYAAEKEAETEALKMQHAAEEKAKDREYDLTLEELQLQYAAEEKAKDRAYEAEQKAKDRAYEAAQKVKDREHEAAQKAADALLGIELEATKNQQKNVADRNIKLLDSMYENDKISFDLYTIAMENGWTANYTNQVLKTANELSPDLSVEEEPWYTSWIPSRLREDNTASEKTLSKEDIIIKACEKFPLPENEDAEDVHKFARDYVLDTAGVTQDELENFMKTYGTTTKLTDYMGALAKKIWPNIAQQYR